MKKILKLFTVLLTLFLFLNNVSASIKTSFADCFAGFNIDYRESINKQGISGHNLIGIDNEKEGNTYFKLSYQLRIDANCDGNAKSEEFQKETKVLYCADANKSSPAKQTNINDVYPFSNCEIRSDNKKEIAYVYENGYREYITDYSATEYLTGNYLTDYYITQAAVWHFTKPAKWMNNFDFSNGTYNGNSNEVISKITKLINDAKTASSGASIKLESTNNNLSLSNDEKYYISSPIKLIGNYINSKITASVSGSETAFITTDKNATSGSSSFDNNSTVYIKIPVEKTNNTLSVTIEVSATTSIENPEIIECSHPNEPEYQPVIMYYSHSSEVTSSKQLQINTYPVKITKKDITNSEEVAGATLTIKNSNGTIVETWVSDTNAKTINLEPGTYTLEETIAPKGYVKSTSKIEFTVDETGKVLVGGKEVKEVVITNEPILITISKRSITSSDELKGATLRITDKNGNIANDVSGKKLEWTSTKKAKTFQLKMGDYILSETIAPEGYELSETTIEFTINAEGKVLIDGKEAKDNLIIFKNTPEPVQVPTGSTLIYIAGTLCLVALGVSIYYIVKRKEL